MKSSSIAKVEWISDADNCTYFKLVEVTETKAASAQGKRLKQPEQAQQQVQFLLSDRSMFNDCGNGIWMGNHHDMGRAIDDDCLIRVGSLCQLNVNLGMRLLLKRQLLKFLLIPVA